MAIVIIHCANLHQKVGVEVGNVEYVDLKRLMNMDLEINILIYPFIRS